MRACEYFLALTLRWSGGTIQWAKQKRQQCFSCQSKDPFKHRLSLSLSFSLLLSLRYSASISSFFFFFVNLSFFPLLDPLRFPPSCLCAAERRPWIPHTDSVSHPLQNNVTDARFASFFFFFFPSPVIHTHSFFFLSLFWLSHPRFSFHLHVDCITCKPPFAQLCNASASCHWQVFLEHWKTHTVSVVNLKNIKNKHVAITTI